MYKKWREHFERLLNVENYCELEEVEKVEISVENVKEEQVETTNDDNDEVLWKIM